MFIKRPSAEYSPIARAYSVAVTVAQKAVSAASRWVGNGSNRVGDTRKCATQIAILQDGGERHSISVACRVACARLVVVAAVVSRRISRRGLAKPVSFYYCWSMLEKSKASLLAVVFRELQCVCSAWKVTFDALLHALRDVQGVRDCAELTRSLT